MIDVEKIKARLLEEKAEAEEEVKKLSQTPDFGDDTDSLDEESDESQEYGNQLSVAQVYKDKIEDIEIALRKIHDGTYGKCEKCGEDISEEILEVNPTARFCKNCQ